MNGNFDMRINKSSSVIGSSMQNSRVLGVGFAILICANTFSFSLVVIALGAMTSFRLGYLARAASDLCRVPNAKILDVEPVPCGFCN